MHQNVEKVIITEEKLQMRIRELGVELASDYNGKEPLFVGVLRGAIMFIADLARVSDFALDIDFMAVASYGSSTRQSGVVRILKDLDEDIKDRHVLLIEDILDTGLTLNYLIKNLRTRQPASLEICALLVKKGKQKVGIKPKYVGFNIPARFVVGYGLDYDEKYRNLPYICTLRKGVVDENSA